MRSDSNSQLSVTWDQVAAFRLERHHLLERALTKGLLSVASDMNGAQAQLLSAAQISFWSRIHDLQIKDIERALNKRTLVKAACMRRTLFLVPSKQLAVFVRGSARRAEKEIRWARGKGVPERVIDAAIDASLNVLDEPLTRTEIADRVSRVLKVQKQSVHGGGWGSRRKLAAVPVGHLNYPVVDLLHLAGARGVVCYGPYRDREPTFVRANAWIPDWKDLSTEEAEDILLGKYLQAFGPATTADFAMWTGINLSDARDIWAREQSNFATVDVEGWKGTVLRKDLDALTNALFERPQVRLLPFFDTYLLGLKNREHIVDVKHQPKVFRLQGWIAPVILMNGRVTGIWKHTQERNRLLVKVEKFVSMTQLVINDIHKEAQDLGRFLGSSNIEIQID